MRPSLIAIWLCTAVLSTASLGWSLRDARSAHTLVATEASSLVRVQEQIEQLSTIPAANDSASDQRDTTLTARVTAALADTGLPAASLASLSPETRQSLSKNTGTEVSRSRASLTLIPVTLPELGRFLAAWQRDQPAWTVTALELNPQHNAANTVGGDLQLRVVLTLETTTVREAPSTPQAEREP